MYDPQILKAFETISTPTITTLLVNKGLRKVWMRGPVAWGGETRRIVGPAFTLRFIPAREDLATTSAWSSPRSTRAAVESMPEGCVAVASTPDTIDAGIFGDILCARMVKRGVKGLVTDGVLRDVAGVRAAGLPVWSRGFAAPPSVSSLLFEGWQEPIGCGGVAIYPGDLIVADADGVVVVPPSLVEEIARLGPEQERLEEWIMSEVEKGAELPGLYPPNAENRARYEAAKKG
jgi:regulator of RNase E activity RraA